MVVVAPRTDAANVEGGLPMRKEKELDPKKY
jgi:hypothetical protein